MAVFYSALQLRTGRQWHRAADMSTGSPSFAKAGSLVEFRHRRPKPFPFLQLHFFAFLSILGPSSVQDCALGLSTSGKKPLCKTGFVKAKGWAGWMRVGSLPGFERRRGVQAESYSWLACFCLFGKRRACYPRYLCFLLWSGIQGPSLFVTPVLLPSL